jgi:predicted phage terminase large subunit-like protein
MPVVQIETLPFATLRPSAHNARTHSKKQIRQIAASIQRFGFNNPVLIDEQKQIIAGHGRAEAAKLLGMKEVPTVTLSHLSPAEVRAYIIADNRLAELAGWDKEILAIELQALVDLNLDVGLTGFEPAQVDLILDAAQEATGAPTGPEDEIPAYAARPAASRPGDLWQLGRHLLLCGDARSPVYGFVQKVFGTVNPGTKFSQNWSIEAVAHALHKVARGETTRLLITIPPRNLKSTCASIALPAFMLGHDPTKKIICVSYSDDLAIKFANDWRAVMRADWYRRIFPGTRIDKAKDTETEVRTTKRGYRLATSVGGTLTGRGGDVIIIDDPIKPQDAQSKPIREKTIQWYENTLVSRLDDKAKGAIVLVMQRLHTEDLAGHLLEKGGFEHLCLRAIAETDETIELDNGRTYRRKAGEVLDPSRESAEVLHKLRGTMTPLVFSAQYQQRPIPLAGNLIKRDWIKFYDGCIPWEQGEYYVTSWDTAMKSSERSDYSVGTVWQVQDEGRRIYLVDLVRGRFEFPDLVKAAVSLHRKWQRDERTQFLFIEDKGSGTSLIQALKQHWIGVYPHTMKIEGDKVVRLEAQTQQFASGAVHFPRNAPWLNELLAELLAFPGARHDDQVDSVSYALAFINWREANTIKIGRLIY